jgi:glycosyltransferase involved in cell wall biosynthesis
LVSFNLSQYFIHHLYGFYRIFSCRCFCREHDCVSTGHGRISHIANFGRGRALRTGFQEARGEIIITTEADLSWGEDVIGRMIQALSDDPAADAVFASPHLPGGGYRNVPRHRVFLSTMGNRLLNFLDPRGRSMITGMTRAYRASVIKPHHFSQDGKEIHLEIAYRLTVLGHKVLEVPAILSWPRPEGASQNRGKRTNFKKIFSLIASHLIFGIVSGGSKLFGLALALVRLVIFIFGVWACWLVFAHAPSIYLATLVGVLMVLWVTLASAFLLFTRFLQQEITAWQTEVQISRLMEGLGRSSHSKAHYRPVDLGVS